MQSSKKLLEKYLGPFKIISQTSTYLFMICLSKLMHTIYSVFLMSMFRSTIPHTFHSQTKSLLLLVIIDREAEYKILQIINSKIDYRRICKLLCKVIWLGYKTTEEKFD